LDGWLPTPQTGVVAGWSRWPTQALFRQNELSALGEVKTIFVNAVLDHEHPAAVQEVAAVDDLYRCLGCETGIRTLRVEGLAAGFPVSWQHHGR
jgi:hypothetical protein